MFKTVMSKCWTEYIRAELQNVPDSFLAIIYFEYIAELLLASDNCTKWPYNFPANQKVFFDDGTYSVAQNGVYVK